MRLDEFTHPAKADIAFKIRGALDERHESIRQMAKRLNSYHAVMFRILNGENYGVDTLLKILDYLELELYVKHKNE